MLKNKKMLSLFIIALVIIFAGIIMLCVKGLNYDLLYGKNTTIETYLETDVTLSDIQEIVVETFGSKNNIKFINNLDNDILITVKSASDEQIDTFVSKINEKYNLELTKENLIIMSNPQIKLMDLANKYILPLVIIILIILLYFIIRYKKIGINKIIGCTLLVIIGIQAILVSIYAILRVQVNNLTIPIYMLAFIVSILGLTEFFENKIK